MPKAHLLSAHRSVLQLAMVGGPVSGLPLPQEASCLQIYFMMYRRHIVIQISNGFSVRQIVLAHVLHQECQLNIYKAWVRNRSE